MCFEIISRNDARRPTSAQILVDMFNTGHYVPDARWISPGACRMDLLWLEAAWHMLIEPNNSTEEMIDAVCFWLNSDRFYKAPVVWDCVSNHGERA